MGIKVFLFQNICFFRVKLTLEEKTVLAYGLNSRHTNPQTSYKGLLGFKRFSHIEVNPQS